MLAPLHGIGQLCMAFVSRRHFTLGTPMLLRVSNGMAKRSRCLSMCSSTYGGWSFVCCYKKIEGATLAGSPQLSASQGAVLLILVLPFRGSQVVLPRTDSVLSMVTRKDSVLSMVTMKDSVVSMVTRKDSALSILTRKDLAWWHW